MIDAIVVPQGAEYKAVDRAISQSKTTLLPIISIPIGFNRMQAEAKIAQIKALNIKRVLITGLCGSLSPQYSVGNIVIYQSCFDPHQQVILKTAPKLTTAIYHQLSSASLVTNFTSDRIINLVSEKQQIYQIYKTDVIDMEGFSYLKLLHDNNIAVAILRVVSDDTKHDIPDLTQVISEQGSLNTLSLTITMIRKPIAGIRLIKNSLKALQILEKTVQKLIV